MCFFLGCQIWEKNIVIWSLLVDSKNQRFIEDSRLLDDGVLVYISFPESLSDLSL